MSGIWEFTGTAVAPPGEARTGFRVEGADGVIGTVDRWVDEPGRAHVVVDRGMWVFGRSVLIPAGAVRSVDVAAQTVHVSRTKDEIGDAPRFATDSDTTDPAYLSAVGEYYTRLDGTPA
ncbi:hypothetical protein [Streptomyces tsukubensis]|uniref:PRC-barrel domain containing protein n=1 Tax=Streptomyces tsukubensis TaxID=83656 RepID=A0A1V4A716_9ACTN|nr:hypothetical protein [Streptomyces tsukubensis]OON78048.1 hypothetical protein B1H18_17665 [Streptomyces tsukubensis]QFR97211.1 PRC-barrel domain containing protein [Streptomyces tsukubensis]